MDDTFRIFLHRLKDGREEKIAEDLAPDFLGIHEAELKFHVPVCISGSAAVVDDVLVLTLTIATEATMPCAICNQNAQVKIFIPDFCYTEQIVNIKSGIFNYKEVLREQILLELPMIAECNGGDCPERGFLARYTQRKEDQRSNYGSST